METRSCNRAYQLVENEHCAVHPETHPEMSRPHAPHFRRSSSDLSLRKAQTQKSLQTRCCDSLELKVFCFELRRPARRLKAQAAAQAKLDSSPLPPSAQSMRVV